MPSRPVAQGSTGCPAATDRANASIMATSGSSANDTWRRPRWPPTALTTWSVSPLSRMSTTLRYRRHAGRSRSPTGCRLAPTSSGRCSRPRRCRTAGSGDATSSTPQSQSSEPPQRTRSSTSSPLTWRIASVTCTEWSISAPPPASSWLGDPAGICRRQRRTAAVAPDHADRCRRPDRHRTASRARATSGRKRDTKAIVQLTRRPVARGDHRLGVGDRRRDRLLAQHVLAHRRRELDMRVGVRRSGCRRRRPRPRATASSSSGSA